MQMLYLDLFSGISGDMFLGAMIDLGVEVKHLERELDRLGLHGYRLSVERRQNGNIQGVKFDVITEADHSPDLHHHHPHGDDHGPRRHADHRDFVEIRSLIQQSSLSDWVKDKAVSVFTRVAVAEGKIHGRPPEQVHFHEVGALDSIVDIVGACVALEALGKPQVVAGPVVEGTGFVKCEHGRFPLPAPATLEILGARGIPITQCEEPHELVTPTGAALLAEFAVEFGPMNNLAPARVGYGVGTRENRTRPNVLRAVLGLAAKATNTGTDWDTDTVAVIETNLDDINAEILGHFLSQALTAGALEAFHTPIQMKKNRPGVLLTVLCAVDQVDRFAEMILRETTAFGIRFSVAERRKLKRESTTVKTVFGEVVVKLGKLNGQLIQAAPEYESCRQVAERSQAPLRQVYEAACQQARTFYPPVKQTSL